MTVLLGGCVSVHETRHTTESKPDIVGRAEAPSKVLRHVVLFKFKDGTSKEQVEQIESAFCALPDKIDAIYDFEWGTDVGVENLSQGFTHCFIVTFLSEADRAAYLPHLDHKAFGELLGPYIDRVLVIDYWTK
jgi:hypothetical protein